MEFLISHQHINPVWLAALGFVVGTFGGFFGVGGSFIAGPALFTMGLPMNYVVGTDLAHIVGKSIIAARRHHAFGNVDLKLGLAMVLGSVAGVETGARAIESLKNSAQLDVTVGITMILVLVCVSGFIAWESWQSSRMRYLKESGRSRSQRDRTVLVHLSRAVQAVHLPPMVSLPTSGIPQISVWVIVAIGFVGGLFSGFLGGGAGYIRMPILVYILGIPTHVAVGTDLFEIIISAGYGTFTHALKGNVDIMVALVMHTGGAVGAQLGALATERFAGPHIRLAFVPLPLVGAVMMAFGLATRSGTR